MHAILSATPALFVLGLSMHSASPVQAQPLGIGPVETVPLGGTSDQPSGGSSSKDREPAQGHVTSGWTTWHKTASRLRIPVSALAAQPCGPPR